MINSSMLSGLVFFLFGLTLVVKGADWLVDGSTSFARRLGVSELAIGLTIVAFGTSMPELTVNIFSAIQGKTDIAIGNIVGSNICNILLILGIASIISPLTIQVSTVWKEIPFALLSSVLVFTMGADQLIDHASLSIITRSEGLALIGFFFIFLWYIAGMKGPESHHHEAPKPIFTTLLLVLAGLALLIVGGKLVVDGATDIARSLGVSEAVIGLTIVAVGTSIPELATSVLAAVRGKSDLAVGNVVGSNIFNVFWILGFSAVLRPLPFSSDFVVDSLVMIGATVLLFFAVHTGYFHHRLCFWRQRCGHSIDRFDGVILLLAYIGYVVYLVGR